MINLLPLPRCRSGLGRHQPSLLRTVLGFAAWEAFVIFLGNGAWLFLLARSHNYYDFQRHDEYEVSTVDLLEHWHARLFRILRRVGMVMTPIRESHHTMLPGTTPPPSRTSNLSPSATPPPSPEEM